MVTAIMIVVAIALIVAAQTGDVSHPAGFIVPTPTGPWTCSIERNDVLCVSSAKTDLRLRFRALDGSGSVDDSITMLSTRNDPGVAYAPQGAAQTRSDGLIAVRTVGSAGSKGLVGLAAVRNLDKVRVGMLALRVKEQWEPAFDEFALSMLRRVRSATTPPPPPPMVADPAMPEPPPMAAAPPPKPVPAIVDAPTPTAAQQAIRFGDKQWTEPYSAATLPMAMDAVLESQPTATAMIVGDTRFTAGAFADADGAAFIARLSRGGDNAIPKPPVSVPGVKRALAGIIHTPVGELPYIVVHRPSGPGGVVVIGRGGDTATMETALATLAKGVRFATAKPPAVKRELKNGQATATLSVDGRYVPNEVFFGDQWFANRWDAPVTITVLWALADGQTTAAEMGMTTNLVRMWRQRSGISVATNQRESGVQDGVAVRKKGEHSLVVIATANPSLSPVDLAEIAFAIANKATLVVPGKNAPKAAPKSPKPPSGGYLPQF